jgi:hypothetical protein
LATTPLYLPSLSTPCNGFQVFDLLEGFRRLHFQLHVMDSLGMRELNPIARKIYDFQLHVMDSLAKRLGTAPTPTA